MRRSRARSAALAPSLFCLAVAACADEGDTLAASWSIHLSDPTLATRIAVVEATLLEGGCASDVVLYRAEIGADGRGPTPRTLPPGRFGLGAHARDATCRTIARGCTEVFLPAARDGAAFEVTLAPVVEEPACDPTSCTDGRCDGTDDRDATSPRDASHPPADTSVSDAGPRDATPLDTGGSPTDPCRLGRCYRVTTPSTFDEARALCVAGGGDLTSLGDPNEEAFVAGLFEPGATFWIGLSIPEGATDWAWLDGTALGYTRWAEREPSGPAAQSCALAAPDGWSSQRCRMRHIAVCERAD